MPDYITQLWQNKEQEIITQDYHIGAKSTIEIKALKGTITIKTWNHQKLCIEAVKKGIKEEINATTIGSAKIIKDNIIISTHCIDNQKCAWIDYIIIVPETVSVKASIAYKGDIRIKNIQGTIDAFTAYGNIKISEGGQSIRAKSGKGSIKIKACKSFIEAVTSEGSIDISEALKTVVAKTGKGSIVLKQKEFKQPNSIFLETSIGNIQVWLPRQTTAHVQARTLKGIVTSEHPITLFSQTVKLNRETWERMKKEVQGNLGVGGAPLVLEAMKGNIAIEKY